MQFFKHYHNASSSLKLQKLLHEMGAEGYGQYWLLLELLCEKFDGESSLIELHFEEISAKVRIKFGKKLETFVQKLSDFSLLSFQISGKVYKIDAPILFDLQAKDFKFATKKRLSSDSKREEEREKNKDKRIKREEKEELSPAYFESSDRLNFAQFVDLFNRHLGGVGKIKFENHLQTGPVVTHFANYSQKLKGEADWVEVFEIVKNSDFIKTKLGVRSHLAWILKDDNLKRILEGDFSDAKKADALEIVNPYLVGGFNG